MRFFRRSPQSKPMDNHYADLREKMVEEQIRNRGIKDKKVLDVMRKVPRHLFVEPDSVENAYEDNAMPIRCGQTISQPYIVGLMTELLELETSSKVLEIGTGCGYQTAVIAEMVDQVYTVEILPELAQSASRRFERFGYQNIYQRYGNGYYGWRKYAPYDRIIVTAAPKKLPNRLINQLAEGGLMILPIGDYHQDLVQINRTEHGIETKNISGVRFVPMTGAPD